MRHHKTILIWLTGLAILSAFALAYSFFIADNQEEIACTMEAKLCPDGSAVGRSGPNCEFAKCPEVKEDKIGIVFGKVSIGPLCPVEPCNNQINPYKGKWLIITPIRGTGAHDGISLDNDGSFWIDLPQGEYSITLNDCQYLGCSYSLPKNFKIESGKNTELNIDIDTGIR